MLIDLAPEASQRLALRLLEHETQILEAHAGDPINPKLREEIMRRRDEALAQPEQLAPWGDTTGRLRGQLRELRRQKLTVHNANPR